MHFFSFFSARFLRCRRGAFFDTAPNFEMGMFRGLTEQQLLVLQHKTLERITAITDGSAIISGSAGGKSYARQIASLRELQQQLAEINSELSKLDPETYGAAGNKTFADFRGAQCP